MGEAVTLVALAKDPDKIPAKRNGAQPGRERGLPAEEQHSLR